LESSRPPRPKEIRPKRILQPGGIVLAASDSLKTADELYHGKTTTHNTGYGNVNWYFHATEGRPKIIKVQLKTKHRGVPGGKTENFSVGPVTRVLNETSTYYTPWGGNTLPEGRFCFPVEPSNIKKS